MPSTKNVTKAPAVNPAPVEPAKAPEAPAQQADPKLLEKLANEIKQRDSLIGHLKAQVDSLLQERASLKNRLRNTIAALNSLSETALISESECVESAQRDAKNYRDAVINKEGGKK